MIPQGCRYSAWPDISNRRLERSRDATIIYTSATEVILQIVVSSEVERRR